MTSTSQSCITDSACLPLLSQLGKEQLPAQPITKVLELLTSDQLYGLNFRS